MGFVFVVFYLVLLRYVEFVVRVYFVVFCCLSRFCVRSCYLFVLFRCVLFYYIYYVVSCLSLLSFAMFCRVFCCVASCFVSLCFVVFVMLCFVCVCCL